MLGFITKILKTKYCKKNNSSVISLFKNQTMYQKCGKKIRREESDNICFIKSEKWKEEN